MKDFLEDPVVKATAYLLLAAVGIVGVALAAVVVIPVLAVGGTVYAVYKFKELTKPYPTYEPKPQPAFEIPDQAFNEHGIIVGGSGHGKTQLLQLLIIDLLSRPSAPALIIVDSMGAIMRNLQRLQVFNGNDALVILDPEDSNPPALNFFQVPSGISEAQRGELVTYLFSAIDRTLTAKQQTAFPYVAKLLRQIPKANIHTLRRLMDEDVGKGGAQASEYWSYIERMDDLTKDFFLKHFYDKEMTQTRKQIANRLYTILGESDAFTRMFAAKENRFDAFQAIQDRKCVVVNTSKKVLGEGGSALFGRYIIAQARAAAFARSDIPRNQRHLAMLVIDECSDYVDDTMERILSQTRQFGLGMLMACQTLDQLQSGNIRSAVMSNTAIKMVGGVSHADATAFAREMRTTPEHILSTESHEGGSNFATYVRKITKQAITYNVPFFIMENLPRMSEEENKTLRQRNRDRYGSTAQLAAATDLPLAATTDRTQAVPTHTASTPSGVIQEAPPQTPPKGQPERW